MPGESLSSYTRAPEAGATVTASPDATEVEIRKKLEKKVAQGITLTDVEEALASAMGIALEVTKQSIDRHITQPMNIAGEALGTIAEGAVETLEEIPPAGLGPAAAIAVPARLISKIPKAVSKVGSAALEMLGDAGYPASGARTPANLKSEILPSLPAKPAAEVAQEAFSSAPKAQNAEDALFLALEKFSEGSSSRGTPKELVDLIKSSSEELITGAKKRIQEDLTAAEDFLKDLKSGKIEGITVSEAEENIRQARVKLNALRNASGGGKKAASKEVIDAVDKAKSKIDPGMQKAGKAKEAGANSIASIKKIGTDDNALEVEFADGSFFELDEVLESATPKALKELISKMSKMMSSSTTSMQNAGGKIITQLTEKLDELGGK